jgi:hypothetical protein
VVDIVGSTAILVGYYLVSDYLAIDRTLVLRRGVETVASIADIGAAFNSARRVVEERFLALRFNGGKRRLW